MNGQESAPLFYFVSSKHIHNHPDQTLLTLYLITASAYTVLVYEWLSQFEDDARCVWT